MIIDFHIPFKFEGLKDFHGLELCVPRVKLLWPDYNRSNAFSISLQRKHHQVSHSIQI